uniref:Reverse transcriptase zinc-binding domain-containing protein n=1 Tax=Quercus lobata TaxID=97700 RepID=A0A7N2LVS0_QUELO
MSVGEEQWCDPQAEMVPTSSLDGDELLQGVSEPLLLQWEHSGVNTSGFFTGRKRVVFWSVQLYLGGILMSRGKVVVTQEVEEGEIMVAQVKNSKWVLSLMKSFCKLVGFPIVKHEAQCMALFHLLEQDCIDVVNVGSSKGPVNSRQKVLRELLVSTVNYDGLSSKGRNKGSSNGLGGWPSFSCHILYDIGDGSRVKFWQDRWCGGTSLAVRYPDLFKFCRNKDASVAELMLSANGVLFWDVRFIRSVHARDLAAMSDFMATIYGSHIRGRGEDKMCWIPNKVKGFLVSDYYRILAGTASFGFPWKRIWKLKIPSRVAFFVWTAALGKCLTIDNLRKRKGLYMETNTRRPTMDGLEFASIEEEVIQVNVGKSEIVSIGEVSNLHTLVNTLQCRVGSLLMKYLGMPLSTSYTATSVWNPILERMEKKLSGWKRL